MHTSRIIAALLLSLTVTTNAEGQLGGLIKKTVKEATKPKEEPKDAKATTPDGPAFPYELTEASMAAFKRGLELEIKMREDYKSKLAKLKTQEQYQACATNVLDPEYMKLMQDYGKALESAKTPEENQKVMTRFGEQTEALTLKRCGEDPRPVRNAQYETFKKAELAGALEFGKAWRKPSKPDESHGASELMSDDCLEGDDDNSSAPLHLVPECALTRVNEQQQDETAEEKLQWYRTTKELLEKYCSLSPDMRSTARERGISVPGTGTNINWVFSRGFARWVDEDCEHLLKLFSYVT